MPDQVSDWSTDPRQNQTVGAVDIHELWLFDKPAHEAVREVMAGVANSWSTGPGVWFNPRTFGAVGDGTASDQNAINDMIDAVNAVAGPDPVTVVFPPGVYIITGGDNLNTASDIREGLKEITRDNVYIDLRGVELKVGSAFEWRQDDSGTSSNALGLFTSGKNTHIFGGVLNGNLRARPVFRGPTSSGYGGFELGIRIQPGGEGARLYGVESKEWGTDALYIASGDFKAFNSQFIAGRRLACAVVVTTDATDSTPIEFFDCLFAEAGAYADDEYNGPAAGIDVESPGAGLDAVVRCFGCVFRDNRKHAVLLQDNALNCVLQGCHTYGDVSDFTTSLALTAEVLFDGVSLGALQKGGHIFKSNVFHGDHIIGVSGATTTTGSIVEGNLFETGAEAVKMFNSGQSNWRVINNTLPKASKAATFLGTGHRAYGNELIDPSDHTINKSAGASTTDPIDLTAELPCQDVTYEIVAKMNNGNGTYDAYARYILTFVGGLLEGGITIVESAGTGSRTITRSGATITFDTGTNSSFYGLVAHRIGSGTFGT